jgi:hypothetical protein
LFTRRLLALNIDVEASCVHDKLLLDELAAQLQSKRGDTVTNAS